MKYLDLGYVCMCLLVCEICFYFSQHFLLLAHVTFDHLPTNALNFEEVEILSFSYPLILYKDKKLDLSKLKSLADDKIGVTNLSKFVSCKGGKDFKKRRKCRLPAFSLHNFFKNCHFKGR